MKRRYTTSNTKEKELDLHGTVIFRAVKTPRSKQN